MGAGPFSALDLGSGKWNPKLGLLVGWNPLPCGMWNSLPWKMTKMSSLCKTMELRQGSVEVKILWSLYPRTFYQFTTLPMTLLHLSSPDLTAPFPLLWRRRGTMTARMEMMDKWDWWWASVRLKVATMRLMVVLGWRLGVFKGIFDISYLKLIYY